MPGDRKPELVSIIIPVFNEAEYIITTLRACCELPFNKEIIVVDNNSTDESHSLVSNFIKEQSQSGLVRLERATLKGKANAMKVGVAAANGALIVFQDADFECGPENLTAIVNALKDYDVVHGCRVCRPYELGLFPYLANKFILHQVNRRFRRKVSDILTGMRGYRTSVLKSLNIISGGFEIETELTVRILAANIPFKEIDISYNPRTRAEGKKIGIWDFFTIIYTYEKLSLLISLENLKKLPSIKRWLTP